MQAQKGSMSLFNQQTGSHVGSQTGPLNAALTVSELNAAVAQALQTQFPMLRVRGEAQGVKKYPSGHVYFTLKDAHASISCVMFKMRAQLFERLPREGELVELRAKVTLYEPRGDYQLRVDGWEPAGQGALYEAFLQRKTMLTVEGLLDEARKRPLPVFVRRIGIVTSPQAAVLRDVATALARRAPHVGLVLYPSAVQGAEAGAQLAAAVKLASARAAQDGVGLLLVCRGGGSLEDLWCFNDESLARAVAACSVPVISGVGHETDFTLCDFVADLRAPTPTAAAELAATARLDWLGELGASQAQLCDALADFIGDHQQGLDRLQHRLSAASPQRRLSQQKQQVSQLAKHLHWAAHTQLTAHRHALSRSKARLKPPQLEDLKAQLNRTTLSMARSAQRRLAVQRAAVQQHAASLAALNPQRVLERGYAVVLDGLGQAMTAPGNAGAHVSLLFSKGQQTARLQADNPSVPEASRF